MTKPTPSVSKVRALADELESKRAAFPAATSWAAEFRIAADVIAGDIDNLQRELAEARSFSRIDLTNMLVLCGEREVRDVEGFPEKLRALIDGLIAQRQRAEAAEASLAAARRDAERYRWLRDDVALEALFDELPNGDGATFKQGEELDAAIDAAMGATHG